MGNDGTFASFRGRPGAKNSLLGTEGSHVDMSWLPLPAKCGLLYSEAFTAEPKPTWAGSTHFADMRAAFDALSEETKGRVETLSAYHSFQYSIGRLTGAISGTEHGKKFTGNHGTAYLRPLVKVHPETQRKSLYVSMHCFGVPGLAREESMALLDQLLRDANRSPTAYTHRWQPGDLVIWDQRCVNHRLVPYSARVPRTLRGCRVAGDPEHDAAPPPGQEAERAVAEELAWLQQNRPWEREEESPP